MVPEIETHHLEQFGALLDDDGNLPLETALAIVAATEAPLTGITPHAALDALPHGASASAVRTVVGSLDELDPQLRADVVDALQLDVELDDDEVLEPGPRRAREITGGATSDAVGRLSPEAIRERIDTIVAVLQSRSGHTLSVPIRIRVVSARGGPYADAFHTGSQCIVRLFPSLWAVDAASLMSTLGHEVWHCFQDDAHRRTGASGPQWIYEGQAEFVGEALVGGSASGRSVLRDWFLTSNRSLQRRSYDAVGLYGVADEYGADPWRTMLPMLSQSTPAALQTLFGGASPVDAVAAIAKKVAKVPDYGADWDQVTPAYIPNSGAEIVDVPLAGPVTRSRTLGTYATFPVVFAVVAGGDILRLSTSGGTSVSMAAPGAGTVIAAPGESRDLCIRPDDCLCPDGTWPGGGDPPLASAPGEFAVAIGAVEGGQVAVTAERFDRDVLCEEERDIDLVGQWTAPLNTVFDELGRAYGPVPIVCDGPLLVTFGEDMRFTTGFDAVCRANEVSARGVAEITGTYEVGAGTFRVVDSTGSGSMEIGGTTVPLPILDGYRQGLSDPVTYTIEGDQLRYSFTAPDGTTFTFVLTRVS